MSIASLEVRAADAMKHLSLNVKVTGLPTARARLWLGTRIILFGGWVIGLARVRIT